MSEGPLRVPAVLFARRAGQPGTVPIGETKKLSRLSLSFGRGLLADDCTEKSAASERFWVLWRPRKVESVRGERNGQNDETNDKIGRLSARETARTNEI